MLLHFGDDSGIARKGRIASAFIQLLPEDRGFRQAKKELA